MNKELYNTIYKCAERVRDLILYEQQTESSHGLCAVASKRLKRELDRRNIKTDLIKGMFSIDNPNPEYYPDEMENCEQIYFPPHYWLQYNGYIIDITGDQFNEEIKGEIIPEILIAKCEGNLRYIYNELVEVA